MRRKRIKVTLKPVKPPESKPAMPKPVELPMPKPIFTQPTMRGPKVTVVKVKSMTTGTKARSKTHNYPSAWKKGRPHDKKK